MSTPVSSTPPPEQPMSARKHKRTTTAELQEQMQHMISLQYQQQQEFAATRPSPGNSDFQMPPLPLPRNKSDGSSTNANNNNINNKPPLPGGGPTPTTTPNPRMIGAAVPWSDPSFTPELPQAEQQLQLLSSSSQQQQQQQQQQRVPPTSPIAQKPKASNWELHLPVDDDDDDEGVGQGTLLFPPTLPQQTVRYQSPSSDCSPLYSPSAFAQPPSNTATASASKKTPSQQQQQQQQQQSLLSKEQQQLETITSSLLTRAKPNLSTISYGTIGLDSSQQQELDTLQRSAATAAVLSTTNTTRQQQQQHQYQNEMTYSQQPPQQQQQQEPPPPGEQQQQQQPPYQHHHDQQHNLLLDQHDFHYGNPDYHDPYGASDTSSTGRDYSQYSWFTRCALCLCNPFVSCLFEIWKSEALHRSFCFGAIDGMLTGSGIVATFCGMDLLSGSTHSGAQTTFWLHMAVVVFSTAACFADSVCMALGHIWTSHVLASVHARERGQARTQFANRKADAKGQLVDMLLAKGMLKIDAMSLADTLEGYPDLFLSVVTGESLAHAHVENDSSVSMLQQHQRQQHHNSTGESDSNRPPNDLAAADAGFFPVHHAYPSYGRLHDYEMEPDAVLVQSATSESVKESLFMMLGFSIFAIVPSLLFLWVPVLLQNHQHVMTQTVAAIATTAATTKASSSSSSASSSAASTSTSHHVSPMIHPTDIIITVTAIIMWCLGVWKSRFLDSNWLVFGIEAVVVLLICVAAAYGVGWVLTKILLPSNVVLQIDSNL